MSPSAEAVQHQVQRAALSAETARLAAKLWREVDPHNLAADWQAKVHRVAALVAAGQLAAARQADPYLAAILEAVEAEGAVWPAALAGVASDGRDLADLLMYPVWSALSALTRGASLAMSLVTGGALLDLLARTMVADAGRAADLVAMAARPAVTSYVRVVELPACARCILLAGREYGLSTGFARHPRCDCGMEPVTKNYRPTPVDAGDVYGRMSRAQRLKAFGAAAVEAIDAGADIAQVVNARRGMKSATAYGRQVQATSEGVTRRGLAGKRRIGARSPRLMPEAIVDLADDRDHMIRLLKQHGYLI